MKMFDRKAKMDEMETLDCQGWQFLCSGEQLPTGLFHAAVGYKAPPDGRVRSLFLGSNRYDSATQALESAKEIAVRWANARTGDGRGDA